ncbi:hypothetical protein C5167_044821 [Papaver somniferum]|nr:hypothetical protein C5167_044821 [Papaver somniferum]
MIKGDNGICGDRSSVSNPQCLCLNDRNHLSICCHNELSFQILLITFASSIATGTLLCEMKTNLLHCLHY